MSCLFGFQPGVVLGLVIRGVNTFEGCRLAAGPWLWLRLIVSSFALFLPQLAPSHLSALTVNVTSAEAFPDHALHPVFPICLSSLFPYKPPPLCNSCVFTYFVSISPRRRCTSGCICPALVRSAVPACCQVPSRHTCDTNESLFSCRVNEVRSGVRPVPQLAAWPPNTCQAHTQPGGGSCEGRPCDRAQAPRGHCLSD